MSEIGYPGEDDLFAGVEYDGPDNWKLVQVDPLAALLPVPDTREPSVSQPLKERAFVISARFSEAEINELLGL